jgi:hypothetical protein
MNQLKEWMDANDVTPEQAAEFFGKTAGTIRNWRSSGVPATQREWVTKRMREGLGTPSPGIPNRLTVEVDRESFRDWNRAALLAGQLIEDWAVESLNQLAHELLDPDPDDGPYHRIEPGPENPLVAEEPDDANQS